MIVKDKLNNASSVQFSCSVMSNSLRPPWTAAYQTSLPITNSQFSSVQLLSRVQLFATPWISAPQRPELTQTHDRWVGDAIQPSQPLSFNPNLFFSLLQSFPALGSFQMSHFSTSRGQSIRVSASASVLPMNIQDWVPLGWTGWISLQSKGLSRVFSWNNNANIRFLNNANIRLNLLV